MASRWYDQVMNQAQGDGGVGSSARTGLLSSAMQGKDTSPSRPGYEWPELFGAKPPPDYDYTPATGLGEGPPSGSMHRGGGSSGGRGGSAPGTGGGTTGAKRDYFYGDPTATGSGQQMNAGANKMARDFKMPTVQEMAAQGIDPETAQNILGMVNGTGGVPRADALNIRELAPWTGRRFYEYALPDQTNQPIQPGLPRIGV